MKNIIAYLACSFCLLFFGSCSKEDTSITENYFIADELQPYLDLFVEAGEARGLQIDLHAAKIEAYLTSIDENGVVGQCSFVEDTPHTITIDKTYWRRATNLEKEYLIFHELGHCYLARSHRDDQNNNGNCVSLMESGLGNCRSNYKTITKAAYLDELFEY